MNDCCPACRARNYGELATLRAQLADLENQRKEWKRIAQNNIAANVEKEREIADLRSRINSQTDHLNDWIRVADKRLLEADELREENRRLMEINKKLGEQNEQVTGIIDSVRQTNLNYAEQIRQLCREKEELESFRKLSGEYATLAKRDAIRDENKRLQQENQQHAQQIKSLQAELKTALEKNSTFAHLEAERNGWKLSAEEHKAVANSLQQRLNEATNNLEAHEKVWSENWRQKVQRLMGQIIILEASRDHWKAESEKFDRLGAAERKRFEDTNEKLAAALNERDGWKETASQENRNYLWLRGILNDIGGFFGDAAKTDDTGAVTAGVFYSKLPALVEKHLRILGDTVSGASFRALQSKFFTLNKQVRDALDESIRQ